MKKIFLLTLLLGLTGCGENDQSNTSVENSNPVVQTISVATNYSLAASPRTMSVAMPLGGWSVTRSKPNKPLSHLQYVWQFGNQ